MRLIAIQHVFCVQRDAVHGLAHRRLSLMLHHIQRSLQQIRRIRILERVPVKLRKILVSNAFDAIVFEEIGALAVILEGQQICHVPDGHYRLTPRHVRLEHDFQRLDTNLCEISQQYARVHIRGGPHQLKEAHVIVALESQIHFDGELDLGRLLDVVAQLIHLPQEIRVLQVQQHDVRTEFGLVRASHHFQAQVVVHVSGTRAPFEWNGIETKRAKIPEVLANNGRPNLAESQPNDKKSGSLQ